MVAPAAASLRRWMKATFSSDMEMLFLRIAAPEDAPPSPADLGQLVDLLASLEQWHSARSEINPYRYKSNIARRVTSL